MGRLTSRRTFLGSSILAGSASAFALFRRQPISHAGESAVSSYGPLHPIADEETGLELLRLPMGFRYRSFGWTGDPMDNGASTPSYHDGMGVVSDIDGIVTLIRNHEVFTPGPSLAPLDQTYDPQAGGGCTRLRFDTRLGQFLSSEPAIGGTQKNCAGGPTPWGTWLTCEETVDSAHGEFDGKILPFEKDHGFIFEVPTTGPASAIPLLAMGRMTHEAIAVDPKTGIVYETEDNATAGFYRFIPRVKEKLADGGKLQMMKIADLGDTRSGVAVDRRWGVTWVDIDDPLRPHSPRGKDASGVYSQGKAQGASTFARLEGCWFAEGKVFFVSTSGGNAACGQVFEYDPLEEMIRLVFESPSKDVLNYPDNITCSPRGGLVLCEDGDGSVERLCSLSRQGELALFAENNVVLHGERNAIAGDFRKQEWCGATFSRDGHWLFVNIQTPGITFAITGPWESGPL